MPLCLGSDAEIACCREKIVQESLATPPAEYGASRCRGGEMCFNERWWRDDDSTIRVGKVVDVSESAE